MDTTICPKESPESHTVQPLSLSYYKAKARCHHKRRDASSQRDMMVMVRHTPNFLCKQIILAF